MKEFEWETIVITRMGRRGDKKWIKSVEVGWRLAAGFAYSAREKVTLAKLRPSLAKLGSGGALLVNRLAVGLYGGYWVFIEARIMGVGSVSLLKWEVCFEMGFIVEGLGRFAEDNLICLKKIVSAVKVQAILYK